MKLDNKQLILASQYPDIWAETYLTLGGEPFSLATRPYLRPIYREFVPGIKNKIVVVVAGRKVEKTTTAANILLYLLCNRHYFSCLYVAPHKKQVTRFISKNLGEAILFSRDKIVSQMIEKDAIQDKTFYCYDEHGTVVGYNWLHAETGYGDAQSILGIAADCVVVDEVQDFDDDWFPKINEVMSRSKYKIMLVCGTARETGSYFERVMWRESTRNEWNMEKKCWESHNPNGMFKGYHLSQLIHPDTTPQDIELKRLTYTPYRKFVNEVLGEFYSGSMKPLTWEEVLSCCDKHKERMKFFDLPTNPKNAPYMGIDIGADIYYIIVLPPNDKGKMEIINLGRIGKFKRVDDVEELSKIIEKFNVQTVAIDYSSGAKQVKLLQEKFGDRVKSVFYQRTVDKPYFYKMYDGSGMRVNRFHVDRTFFFERVLDGFYTEKYVIPYKEKEFVDPLIEQFTNIRSSEEDDISDKKAKFRTPYTKYGHDGEDHLFHCLVYADIAMYKRDWQPIVMTTKI